MVAGHLQEKRGVYHIVLNYLDESGKRHLKWMSMGLPVKGNKNKAEALLMEARQSFVPGADEMGKRMNSDMLFTDFLDDWLEVVKPTVRISIFASYSSMTKSPVGPYFRSAKLTLSGLQPWDIQNFYNKEPKRVKANTVSIIMLLSARCSNMPRKLICSTRTLRIRWSAQRWPFCWRLL